MDRNFTAQAAASAAQSAAADARATEAAPAPTPPPQTTTPTTSPTPPTSTTPAQTSVYGRKEDDQQNEYSQLARWSTLQEQIPDTSDENQAAAEAEKIERMNAQSTGKEQGAATTGKIAALQPGSTGTETAPSQIPGAEVIGRKEDEKDLEELTRWSKLAGIPLNEQDIDSGYLDYAEQPTEELAIQTEDPVRDWIDAPTEEPVIPWQSMEGTKQDITHPEAQRYYLLKKALEHEGIEEDFLEGDIEAEMGYELDQVTENKGTELEEIHSAKQRRYMCAMKDKSADKRPKGLSKAEASEMCSGPMKESKQHLKALVLKELEQMRVKGGGDPKSIDTIKTFVKQALLQEIDGGIMDPGMVPFVPHRQPAADTAPLEDEEEPLEVDKKYDVALDAREATERLIVALDNAIYDAPYEHAFKATMSLRDALNSLEHLGAQPKHEDRVVAPLKDEQPTGSSRGTTFMPMTYTGDTIS